MKLKQRVKKLVEDGQKAVNQISVGDGGQENILQQFKEVNKLLGSADTEITLLKVSLSSLSDSCQDEKVVVNAQKMEKVSEDSTMNPSLKGVEEKCEVEENVVPNMKNITNDLNSGPDVVPSIYLDSVKIDDLGARKKSTKEDKTDVESPSPISATRKSEEEGCDPLHGTDKCLGTGGGRKGASAGASTSLKLGREMSRIRRN